MLILSNSPTKVPRIIKKESLQVVDYYDANSSTQISKQPSIFTNSKLTTGRVNHLMQYYANQDNQNSVKRVNMVKAYINSQLQQPQRDAGSIITKITNSGRGLQSQGRRMNLESRQKNVSETIVNKFQSQFQEIRDNHYSSQTTTLAKITGLNSARLEQINKQISKDYGYDSKLIPNQSHTTFGRFSSCSKVESAIQPLRQTLFEMKNYDQAQRHHNRSFTIKQPSPPKIEQTEKNPYIQTQANSTQNLTATQRDLLYTLGPFKIYHSIVTRQEKKRSSSTVKVPHKFDSPLFTSISQREHSPPKMVLQKSIKPLDMLKSVTVDSNRQRYEKMYQVIQLKLKEKQILTDNQFQLKKNSKIQPHMYLNDTEDQKHLNPLQMKKLGSKVFFKKLDRAKSLFNIADQMVVQENDFRRQVQLHQQ